MIIIILIEINYIVRQYYYYCKHHMKHPAPPDNWELSVEKERFATNDHTNYSNNVDVWVGLRPTVDCVFEVMSKFQKPGRKRLDSTWVSHSVPYIEVEIDLSRLD